MLDARDAMLAADRMRFDGADQAAMWGAFAKRGMGSGASTPDADSGDSRRRASPRRGRRQRARSRFSRARERRHGLRRRLRGPGHAGRRHRPRRRRSTQASRSRPAATSMLFVSSRGSALIRFTRDRHGRGDRRPRRPGPAQPRGRRRGATVIGSSDGSLNAGALIDGTEATNWAGVNAADNVDATQPVRRGRPRRRRAARSAGSRSARCCTRPRRRPDDLPLARHDPDSGSRFTALRQFALEACVSCCSSADARPGSGSTPRGPTPSRRCPAAGGAGPDAAVLRRPGHPGRRHPAGRAGEPVHRLRRRTPASRTTTRQRHRLQDGVGPRARSCTPRSSRSTDRRSLSGGRSGHAAGCPRGSHPRTPRTSGLHGRRRFGRVGAWSDASPSWTSCPSSTSVGSRPRRPSASPSRSRATVFREGHDQLGAEVVAHRPRRRTPRPGADGQARRGPRPLRRLGHPRRRGRLDLRGPGLVRPDRAPGSTTPGIKIPAGVDVELMFTEGGCCSSGCAPTARPGRAAHGHELRRRTRSRPPTTPTRPVEARLAAAAGPASSTPCCARHPLRELVTVEGPYPVVRRPRARAVRQLVRVLPALRGRHRATPKTGKVTSGTFRTAAKRLDAVAAMGFDVIYLPPIHPIGEVNRKGPNNTLDPGPDDPGSPWAIGSQGRRARRDPPRPRHARRLRRLRRRAPASSASRSRSTSRCRPRPTTRG